MVDLKIFFERSYFHFFFFLINIFIFFKIPWIDLSDDVRSSVSIVASSKDTTKAPKIKPNKMAGISQVTN